MYRNLHSSISNHTKYVLLTLHIRGQQYSHRSHNGEVIPVNIGESLEVPPSPQLVHRLVVTQVTVHRELEAVCVWQYS